MKKSLMALVAASLLVPAAARAQMFTATVTGQASGFISPGDQLGGEYGGIVYAGTLDGVTPLFVQRCDYGMMWNPDTDACEGTRGGLPYGSYNVITGATSTTDGVANTAILAARTDTPAASYCANLAPPDVNSHGYSDWYMPSRDELVAVMLKSSVIGRFASSYYETSTETASTGFAAVSYAAAVTQYNKATSYYVRCMRKGN